MLVVYLPLIELKKYPEANRPMSINVWLSGRDSEETFLVEENWYEKKGRQILI